nr:ulp1 protease family, C-terminal catalytic domain-containing protein [Tanacetum cinerariifolium]
MYHKKGQSIKKGNGLGGLCMKMTSISDVYQREPENLKEQCMKLSLGRIYPVVKTDTASWRILIDWLKNILRDEPYDHVWLAIKELWNIPNNDARQSEEFKLKSAKAKASALQNKNPSRLGRTGLSDMEGTWRADWDQLVLQQPWLSVIQNDRSKIYALAHLPKDKALVSRQLIESMEGTLQQLAQKEQDMREDGTYHVVGRDPIREVFGKEHGGRTRGVSTVLGPRFKKKLTGKKNEIEGLKAIVAHLQGRESLTCLGSSCASVGFDDLEDPTPCDLLWPYQGHEFRVAVGKVYPTRDATLHGSSMSEGYIKVQVDTVEDAFKAIPVPKETESVHQLEQPIF